MSLYRVENAQGGHDLTAEGWAVIAKFQKEFSQLTDQVAAVAQVFPRNSPQFRQAHKQWQEKQLQMLAFVLRGELPN